MFLLILLSFLFTNSHPILANDRNIFGLHLTQTSDIHSAAKIVNSTGGNWGYITVVIRTDQLNKQAWQEFFDNCRKYHLIPLIRLATILDGESWKVPALSDIDNLANFLNSLNWPSVPQHIILFNEINHGSEWGGTVDIKTYIDLSLYAINKFKSLNSNFFLLGTGLDLASPEKPPLFKSAANVYREIYLYKPEYFELIDGLASHSYPNHGYVGKPTDTGQHSIRGYRWEINFLKSLKVNKYYPVFITETGWPHREGDQTDNHYYSASTTAAFLKSAIQIWQQDSQIQAVTPFIYNYPNPPFDHFSWLNDQELLRPEYQLLVDLPKTQNRPIQRTSYQLIGKYLPFIIFINTEYSGQIVLKNTGQSIWGETEFCLKPFSSPNITLEVICTNNQPTLPGQSQRFNFKFKVNSPSNNSFVSWENLPDLEIAPIVSSGKIFSPKINFFENLMESIKERLDKFR